MGERLTSVHEFPPDKVCDYIFYDSLYKEGNHNLLPDQTTYTESLNAFINNHPGYRRTTLGIGFAFDFLARAEEDLKVKDPSPLAPFWSHGIFHAGILDTPIQPTRYHTQSAIETLKTINELLDTQRSRGQTVITAIAVPHPEIAWAISFVEDFSEVSFTPHLVISIGHYRHGDDKPSTCTIVPPTRHPDDVPPQDILLNYGFDVSTPMYQLRYLYSQGTATIGVVSVTLKGSWTHPLSSANVSFYDPCSPEAIPSGSYTELCRVKALGTDVPFGIAVYGVDYDDYDDKCGTLNTFGAYSRLKALRNLVDYFKETAPFNETACRTFVKG
ncbi:uncharacterized protein LOC119401001 isoform X2 [Rhipicephalus sanguineus]|uniref:uncharacterized protein LOC119401001 isoform X2 n=1 Tax=Rhipicephalus sanguineus TaxID=34632 RepID=UPI00189567F5|nr:uncharacterized protein LOC119401001 isoform X2 [Rhipicephalus sanguineus]